MRADRLLDIVRRAPARLPTLHAEDGAEPALERTASAGVEAGVALNRLADELGRQQRGWLSSQSGQFFHVVVDRAKRSGSRILQQPVHSPLQLAGEQADAKIERLLHIR